MSQRTSAILWLIIALFCGFFSLVACVGGGYATWHTDSEVKRLEKSIEEDDKERTDPKTFVKPGRLDELEKRLPESERKQTEYVRYRYFAIAAAAISVIPGLMTLAFLVVAVAKFMKKSAPASDDDEEDEEPPEKKPTPKAKPKPKPKNNDD
jgi:TRAP-type C4-dicarboxylate transport system permease small subunit